MKWLELSERRFNEIHRLDEWDESSHPRAENGQFGESVTEGVHNGQKIQLPAGFVKSSLPMAKSEEIKRVLQHGATRHELTPEAIQAVGSAQARGISSEQWRKEYDAAERKGKDQNVNIADLHGVQTAVEKERVQKIMNLSTSERHALNNQKDEYGGSKDRINIVKYRGKMIVTGGHHRVEAAHQLGDKTIQANVFDLDKHFADMGESAPKWYQKEQAKKK